MCFRCDELLLAGRKVSQSPALLRPSTIVNARTALEAKYLDNTERINPRKLATYVIAKTLGHVPFAELSSRKLAERRVPAGLPVHGQKYVMVS